MATLAEITGWREPEEERVLDGLSLDAAWPIIEFFAPTYRLSGSADERTCVNYLLDRLSEWGVPHTLHEPTLFVSWPLEASVRIPGGREFEAKTPSMSPSTDGWLEGELVYVKSKTAGRATKDLFAPALDPEAGDVRGKIVLAEGLALPANIVAIERAGALGGIFISPGQNIHDGVCTTIWGAPDFDSIGRQPTVPVVAVNNPDGQSLIDYARSGGKIAIRAKLDTRWRPIPIVVAEIQGTEEPEKFVLLHGHLDGWLYGVADNATGNAAMAEIARVLQENRGLLKRSVRIAWWSGHSHGRYAGSTWYADTYGIDLYNNCLAQVNCDSPGARWATTYNRLSAQSEAHDFVALTIRDLTGIVAKPERPPRAGDYSFNQIGLTGFYMLSSTMSDEKKAEQGFYEVGGCGGNIGWHTKDDTMELADRENLLRDIRMYAASVLRLANAPVLPMNYLTTVTEVRGALDRYADVAAGSFDFAPIYAELVALETALTALQAAIPADISVGEAREINRALMRIGRTINPITNTRAQAFHHDPALSIPLLPDLAPALSAGEITDEAGKGVLRAHLTRGQNRIVWALQLAREAAERVG